MLAIVLILQIQQENNQLWQSTQNEKKQVVKK